jgi:hypothetical protein
MNPADGIGIDHINRNKLDNRRSNLRLCNMTQNLGNILPRGKFKGVSFDKTRRKYVAQISAYHKHYHLGRYNTPEEAHFAYTNKAKELFGEFARVV